MPEILIVVVVAVVLLATGVGIALRRRPGVPAEPEEPEGIRDAPPQVAEPPGAPVEAQPEPVVAEQRPSLRDRLRKSRKFLADRIGDAIHGAPDDETWEDLEAALIQADIGVEAATRIVGDLKEVLSLIHI